MSGFLPAEPGNSAGGTQVPTWAARAAVGGLVLIMSGLAILSLRRHKDESLRPDFEYFYRAGEVLLTRGVLDDGYDRDAAPEKRRRGTLEWYLPTAHRVMTLFGWMPPMPAGICWSAANLTAWIAVVWLVARHFSGFPPQLWAYSQVLPILLLTGCWYWDFILNQVNTSVLLLLLLFLICGERGRPALSGFWLGLAILLKLTPGLLLIWLLLKRRFRAIIFAALTVILAGPVADTLVFGAEYTRDLYAGWAQRTLEVGSTRGVILSNTDTDWRNQSCGAVMARWLHHTNYSTRWYNDPRLQGDGQARYLNITNWELSTIATVVSILSAAGLLILIWFTRRPAQLLTNVQLRVEFALYLVAMLWFMPIVRRYHLVWCYPAVALLCSSVYFARLRGRWLVLPLIALAACGLVQLPFVDRGQRMAEAAGDLFAMTLLLGTALIWLGRRAQKSTELVEPSTPASTDEHGARETQFVS